MLLQEIDYFISYLNCLVNLSSYQHALYDECCQRLTIATDVKRGFESMRVEKMMTMIMMAIRNLITDSINFQNVGLQGKQLMLQKEKQHFKLSRMDVQLQVRKLKKDFIRLRVNYGDDPLNLWQKLLRWQLKKYKDLLLRLVLQITNFDFLAIMTDFADSVKSFQPKRENNFLINFTINTPHLPFIQRISFIIFIFRRLKIGKVKLLIYFDDEMEGVGEYEGGIISSFY